MIKSRGSYLTMALIINIVIFGFVLFEGVELVEHNVAYVVIILGYLLKLLITNILSRPDDTPLFDIYLGTGFTALFQGNFGYVTNPIKKLFLLKGPLFSLIVVVAVAYGFPLVGPEIVDLEDFRSFIFIALSTGYSADIIVQQLRDQFSVSMKSAQMTREILQMVQEAKQ